MMGLVDRKWPMIRSANVCKVARARSVDLRCLLLAMGMRAKIGHVGTVGHEMSILKELGTLDVCKPLGYVAHDTST